AAGFRVSRDPAGSVARLGGRAARGRLPRARRGSERRLPVRSRGGLWMAGAECRGDRNGKAGLEPGLLRHGREFGARPADSGRSDRAGRDRLRREIGSERRGQGPAPEIARHAGVDEATFAFTPHLLPTGRGILATLYVRPATDAAGIAAAYERAYAGAPFVRLRGGELPEMGALAHTNFCDLGWKLRPDGKQAVIVSCLDNLVKGAA